MKKITLVMFILIIAGCSNNHDECFDKDRPWDFFDYCYTIPGTPQYEQSQRNWEYVKEKNGGQ